ncbi:hypothetical protein FS749_005327 [Ceratobasidium sp. UAMH 11750]|nr:hypothetical protein FS749_005327 [Ceratobasidium sp. UAMH 11750]
MSGIGILPVVLAWGAISAFFYSWYYARHSVPLPPGPKGLPLLGNALDLRNTSAFWLKFAEYADQYGPIITVNILHKKHIVISDPELASELFEKRGSNYAGRRISEMIKLTGYDKTIAQLQYGPTLKRYRAWLHRELNNRASMNYLPLQHHEIRKFMRRLVENPEDFLNATRLMSSSVFLRIAYGYDVKSDDDRFVQNAKLATAAFSETMQPTRWAVDMFPPLRYLPVWFPLATFHRRAREIKHAESVHREEPFAYLEKQLAEGTAEPSFASKLLQFEDGKHINGEDKEHIKYLASALYAGGAGNTVSALESFFLAMTLYPDVQAKARAEIDAYCKQRTIDGYSAKMISFEDRPNLPYTSAVVRELYRWHPSLHMTGYQSGSKDDINVVSSGQTYRIPARSFVIVNMWKIMHDPKVYVEPDRFMPERYLVTNPPPEPETYAFGFGRRVCPGIAITQQTLWIAVSNILTNFYIKKSRDKNGVEITPEERYSTDLSSHPLPFLCTIVPREGCEEWLLRETE